MKRCFTFALLIVTIIGCSAPEISILLQDVQPATDPTYGYTFQNPIRIGYYNEFKSMDAATYYLLHLRGSGNQKLLMLSAASIRGDNGIIDGYKLLTSRTKDTIHLYIDANSKGPLFIPKGLEFEK